MATSEEQQFTQATFTDPTVAPEYLKRVAGDAKKAIALYFEEHPQDACDGCGERLAGNRYKCGECEDFELCDKCVTSKFESDTHFASHSLLEKTQSRDRGWSFSRGQNSNPRGAFIANRK